MIGLTSLEMYNSIFNITEHNNNLKIFEEIFDMSFCLQKSKNAVEEIVGNSDITTEKLKDDVFGPVIISSNRNLQLGEPSTEGHTLFLMAYAASSFLDFES